MLYEKFLVERYDSYILTCRRIEIFSKPADINHMLIYDDNLLVEIIIYEINAQSATCLNSLTYIKQDNFKLFADTLFNKYPTLKKIDFPSSYNIYSLDRSIIYLRSNDFVIDLPTTIEEYIQNLGSSTRANYKKHKNKFLRECPQANFVKKDGADIEEHIISKIIELNFERIKFKKEVPHTNHTHLQNIYEYTKHYGKVTYIEVDGIIIAGCIAFMANKSIYSNFLAHDNNYSQYNPGQLCMVYLIQESIESGFSKLHLLWGETDYKTRFLAKPHQMFSYYIYRNFSVSYCISKTKALILYLLHKLKASKYSKPIKDLVKKMNKMSTQQISKLEFKNNKNQHIE